MKIDEAGEFRLALLRLKTQLSDSASIPRGPAYSRPTLDRVERALRRIDEDTFGICSGCFLVMPRAQLLMRPYMETCPNCAARRKPAALQPR